MRDSAHLALESQKQTLAMLTKLVESQSPERIMQLGFAVARVNGKAITSRSQVEAGDILTIEVTDGVITTKTLE